MVEVTERSANWRIIGGTGVGLGGLLIGLGALLGALSMADVGFWLSTIGFIVFGIALFFVAFGETGSNGAVGASTFGKAVLVIAGAAAILYGILNVLQFFGVALPEILGQILFVAFAIFLVLSAIAIFQRGVAKGVAKWILFIPAVIAIVALLDVFIVFDSIQLLPMLFGLFALITGIAYLFNKADFK